MTKTLNINKLLKSISKSLIEIKNVKIKSFNLQCKVNVLQGALCDGSAIEITSLCCKDDSYVTVCNDESAQGCAVLSKL